MNLLVPNSVQIPIFYIDHLMGLLHANEFNLLIFMLRHTWGAGSPRRRFSIAELAKETGHSQPTIRKVLGELQAYGLVAMTADPDPAQCLGAEWEVQVDQGKINLDGLNERKHGTVHGNSKEAQEQAALTEELVVPKSTKKTKRSGMKKERAPHMEHGAIQIYKGLVKRTPAVFVREKIVSIVDQSEVSLGLWKEIIELWLMKGWNPGNIEGMLNKFEEDKKRGGKPTHDPLAAMRKAAQAQAQKAAEFEEDQLPKVQPSNSRPHRKSPEQERAMEELLAGL